MKKAGEEKARGGESWRKGRTERQPTKRPGAHQTPTSEACQEGWRKKGIGAALNDRESTDGAVNAISRDLGAASSQESVKKVKQETE
jgi:hypothetical protein